jgi:hypothetical protein
MNFDVFDILMPNIIIVMIKVKIMIKYVKKLIKVSSIFTLFIIEIHYHQLLKGSSEAFIY